ncbi:transposase [Candidatus Roizmanbacteria bacterium]|nr:transposase [Candidatus Roizmanbacteria bacterium]
MMPNHVHGIIVIRNSNQSVGNDHRVVPMNNNQVGHDGPTLQNTMLRNIRQQQLLFRIIQWFKTITTNIYIKGVKNNQFPRFDKRIWQKSFYDHVIRNEYDLSRIRQYIKDNPINWEEDRNNSENLWI